LAKRRRKSYSICKKGPSNGLSFMGTVKKDQSQQEFVQDFILAGETGL